MASKEQNGVLCCACYAIYLWAIDAMSDSLRPAEVANIRTRGGQGESGVRLRCVIDTLTPLVRVCTCVHVYMCTYPPIYDERSVMK